MKEETRFKRLIDAYNAEEFRTQGYQVVDMLADYLARVTSGEITSVLPHKSPDEMLGLWQGDFPVKGKGEWRELVQKTLDQSNHLHHPGYIGHQVTAPLPLAALMDMIGAFLNNGSAVYEMGPVNVAMEKRVIQWLARQIGYNDKSDGIFTSGGTLGNLTALLAARQAKADYNVWKQGVQNPSRMVVMISAQAHYSVQRAVSIMGLGADAVVPLPVDRSFRIDINELAQEYRKITEQGRQVVALVDNGCSTATGSYDQLEPLADFCEKNNIWLHVDGAHGASALLSSKYRGLLQGVDRVDSIVWDAHKMFLMPALTTAVIFKEGHRTYESFSQEATYLFARSAREEWYNFAHRTMECTKKMMGLKMYVCLHVLGSGYFTDYVERMYDLTQEFAQLIEAAPDFELALSPQSNIICFRYLKEGCSDPELNVMQAKIRQKILENESYYIVQTDLQSRRYLRCTIINPLTTLSHLQGLLRLIRDLTL